MERRRLGCVMVLTAVMLACAAPSAHAQSPAPYGVNDAGGFLNVLPAGEQGLDNAVDLTKYETTGAIPPHFNDQLPLYENLEYAAPTLTDAHVPQYFKDATLGVPDQNVASTES